MIAAVVRDNIVENLIVIDGSQIEEMQAALGCDLVDARPYGLSIGDLRSKRGWTRNDGGEQMVLPLLEPEHIDSYTIAALRADAAEKRVECMKDDFADMEAALKVLGVIEYDNI